MELYIEYNAKKFIIASFAVRIFNIRITNVLYKKAFFTINYFKNLVRNRIAAERINMIIFIYINSERVRKLNEN